MMPPKVIAQAGSTVATAMSPASGSSRFLNMIGIERVSVTASESSAAPPSKGSSAQSPAVEHTPTATTKWVNPRSQSMLSTKETLKYDRVADQKYSSPKRRKTECPSDGRKSRALIFNEEVDVVPIKSRNEYSNRVRSRIWSNALEIQENATRNAIEFASEG